MNDQEPSKKKDLDRKLEKLRVKIDSVDEKLISFLNQRAEIVKEIGEIKKELGYNVFQPNREKDIYQKLEQEPSPLKFKSLKAIWKEIMAASKELQGQILEVGYLGPKGTFTHQAALKYFPKANTEFIACNNIDEIFRDIEKDILNFGAIPIENNFQGTVRETLDLLIEKDLNIYGEIELRIIQNLISHKDAELSDIDKIYSHPQAFAQTRTWIKKHLPNAKLINTASTAEAVYKISSSDSKNIAAIGTDFAAKVYNLKLLRTKIEDHPSNFTRFLMISKQENEERNDENINCIRYKAQTRCFI